MSDDARSGPECGRYVDEIAELALGISTGRERAQALAHLEACPRIVIRAFPRANLAAAAMHWVVGQRPPRPV